MSEIYVFGPNEEQNDYTTFGLAGALVPTKCEFSETANGESIVTMEHPLDDFGRYKCLQRGNILVVPVPTRTTPAIQNGSLITTVWTYKVKPLSQLTGEGQRTLYKNYKGSGRIKVLNEGEVITVVEKPPSYNRWRVKTNYGEGWINNSEPMGFELVEEKTLGDNSSDIELVQSPWTVRNQYFRIYEVNKKLDGVDVSARHITYDLLYNMTGYYEWQEESCIGVAHGLLNNMYNRPVEFADIPFHIYTNVSNRNTYFDYRQKNIIDALLDPEEGVCKRFNVGLVRDNYNLYLLNDPGLNRGMVIEYGNNMTGVEFKTSDDGIVTRVVPIGETAEGGQLFLRDLIDNNKHWDYEHIEDYVVDSSHIGDYPVIHIKELKVDNAKVGEKEEGGGTVTVEIARERMRAAAQKQFTDDKIDEMKVEMTVEFARLGEAEEYKQFEGLDNCFLFDYVRIKNPRLDIDTTAQIVQITWDCLAGRNGRMTEIKIGAVGDTLSNVGITTWQIPSGFSGSKIADGTVGGNVFKEATIGYAKISAAAIDSLTAEAAQIAVANIKDLTVEDITATNLKAAIADIAQAEIGTATIDTAKINWAEINQATINQLQAKLAYLTTANIGSANIDWASISTLAANYAKITNGVISNATIDQANVNNLSSNYAHISNGVIDNASIGWANIDNLDTNFLNTLKAKIQTAEVTNLIANQINAGSIAVSNLDASNAKIGFANIYDLTADRALISKGVGGKFYFSDLAVTAAMISELTVGKLLMKDTANGQLKRLVIDSSSASGYSLEDPGRTIRGDDIVTQTIVADNLDVSEIFANTALINQIHGRCINVATLFAQEAFISQLDSYVIRANTISAIESNLNLTADGAILMAVGKNLHSGGKNMLRMSKTFEKGSDTARQWMWGHEWSDSEPYGVSLMSTAPETGFKHILFRGEGLSENQWAGVWSPLIELPSAKNTTTGVSLGDWYGRKVTLSAYVFSGNWRAADGFQFQVCLSDGSRARQKYGGKRVFYIDNENTVVWGDDVKCDQNIKAGAWRRIAITFTLDENDISASTDDSIAFQDCTHMFAAFYFTKNGNARIYAPKLEWGTLASDWSAAPEDSLDETNTILNTLFTIEDGQIKGFVSEQTYDTDINNASTGLKKLVSDNTTFRTQTSTYISDFVRSTAWGSPTDNLGNIFTKMWSGVTANREGLTLEAGKLIGSTQLMRRTKGMPSSIAELGYSSSSDVPSDVDTSSATLWRLSAPTSGGTVVIDRRSIGSGEYARWITSTGNTGDVWAAVHSPLVSLGGSWAGRQVTFSFYVRSPDWTAVDSTFNVYLNLTTGVSAGRLYSGGKTINKTATVEWADTDGLTYEMALRNGNWRRAAVTFTLNETDIPKYGTHDTAFGSCTHMYATFFLRRNGEVGFRLPKLEWGAKASDWAEASEDVSDSSSAKIKITDDRILSTVNKLNNRSDTNIDTAISQVEQTANSWRSVVTTVNGNGTTANPGLVSKVTAIEQSDAFLRLKAGKFSNADDDGAASRNVVVEITPEAFSVTANGSGGEEGRFELTADGGKVDTLTVYEELDAPNVAPRYSGPTTLYVNPAATASQIASGNYFKTLAGAANALRGKWLASTVTINLTMASSAAADTEKATFSGICGSGWINLVGNASAPYRMIGTSASPTTLEFISVTNIISISNIKFQTPENTNGNFGIHFSQCYFEVSGCVFSGPGVSSAGGRGILVNRGARGYVNNCEFYDYQYGVLSQRASDVQVVNSKGNSRIGGNGGRMIVVGTASSNTTTFSPYNSPAGVVTYGTVTVDQGSKPSEETIPTESTYALTYSDSYSPGNGAWSFAQHDDPMQGFTGGAIIKGCMWFASMSGLSGKTIKSAKIRLYQESGVGRGGSVPVTLYGTNTAYSGRSSEPPITQTYGAIGSTNPGENTELSIPTSAITDLVSGTIQALMIYAPDDQDVYKGRQYSKNYARFRGTTTGSASTKPLITVTYV